jgi:energy-coupling factor transporter ATP-binding protein EcfA2
MLIKDICINGRSLKFSSTDTQNVKENESCFTILIGKNASGKSETLKEICHLLIRSQIQDDFKSAYVDILDHYLDRNYKDILHRGDKNISSELELIHGGKALIYKYVRTDEKRNFVNYLGKTEYLDEKVFRHYFEITDTKRQQVTIANKVNIVAVSSGQFDKFPVLQSMGLSSGTGIKYSYVGVQNDRLSSRYDSALALRIGEIGHSILKFHLESSKLNLDGLLNTLGFTSRVKLQYKINAHELSKDFKKQDMLNVGGTKYASVGLGNNRDTLTDEDIEGIKNARSYFEKHHNNLFEVTGLIGLDLFSENDDVEINHLYYSAKVNALEIKDVSFEGELGICSLALASSGQINLLNIFFGIASCIENDSLILIDEPEISLHADWQMKFIPLLRETFLKYKRCHFIVATHAPMIISNVGSSCSSILNMTTGDTVSSSAFNNQSSDYLNYYLFETPGPKNETMNREVVSLLSVISKRKQLSESQLKKAKLLIKWSNGLVIGDPIKELVSILAEALEIYSHD